MRVSGLLNCGIQIPSLEVGRQFYTDFGLSVAEAGNVLSVRCDGRDQDQVVLTEGPAKRLHHVAFAVEPGSLPDWQRHLEGMQVTIIDPPPGVAPGGLCFEDIDGNVVVLRDRPLAGWRPFEPEDFNFGDVITRTDVGALAAGHRAAEAAPARSHADLRARHRRRRGVLPPRTRIAAVGPDPRQGDIHELRPG